jgi:DNA-binding MarR family transcriptional regulator
VNRSEENGFIRRARKSNDRRVVQVELTPRGERVLRDLTLHHREALSDAAPALAEALDALLNSLKAAKTSSLQARRRSPQKGADASGTESEQNEG